MGIAVSIVSAVLKSVVGDKLGSGLAKDLIGISIDGVSEKGINEIADFINNRRSKIDSILSRVDNDYVVAEIKGLLLKVEITDEVLRQCRYNSKNLFVFLLIKYCENKKKGYIEYEREIKQCLFDVAEALFKIAYESEDFGERVLIHISNSVDDANLEIQQLSIYMKENLNKLDVDSQIVLNILWTILEQIQKIHMQSNIASNIIFAEKNFINNKKEDYIKNWNNRLFLHIDNDENPITLADAFIMPDYVMNKSMKRIGFSKNDTLNKIIEKFIEYDKTSTMLISGEPGMGKSSIISWIANEYRNDDRIIILRFRDWKRSILKKTLLSAIRNKLDCENADLEDKVLILDGFDEMKALDIREKLLADFINEIKDFNNFKCIITSRPVYIDSSNFQNYLKLKVFDISRIEDFHKIVTEERLDQREKIESNLEVLGIPVILYMAIMSGVDISQNPTKPELYRRIFSEEGGIFDKFCFEEGGYDVGQHILRSSENIKKYLKFLREVAFEMFRKDDLPLIISECQLPELTFHGKSISILGTFSSMN